MTSSAFIASSMDFGSFGRVAGSTTGFTWPDLSNSSYVSLMTWP